MTTQIEKRKESHINLSKDSNSQMDIENVFDKYELPYKALPEISLEDVDTSVNLFGKKLAQPLIIASMTGGSEHSMNINKNIAIAAEETGVAFGVGSMRITLVNEEAKKSFSLVREHAPNAFIFANIGAVQLNYGVKLDQIKSIIDLIKADALYLHLNPLQEALQPEGDTDFSNLVKKIEDLVKNIDVPVFVKEVGHGIGADTARLLFDAGVSNIDVAGAGGTSWAWIEAKRAQNKNFETWFKNYGLPTDECISEIFDMSDKPESMHLVASGGIRSPLEGLKAILLGADLYSAAKPFLESAMQDSPDDLINLLKDWERGLKIAMFCAGLTKLQS